MKSACIIMLETVLLAAPYLIYVFFGLWPRPTAIRGIWLEGSAISSVGCVASVYFALDKKATEAFLKVFETRWGGILTLCIAAVSLLIVVSVTTGMFLQAFSSLQTMAVAVTLATLVCFFRQRLTFDEIAKDE